MRFFHFRPTAVLAVIFFFSAILNFHAIDSTSLWNDEAFSFFVAQGSLRDTIHFIADDTQPPLYYLALNLWLGLGSSVFVIRGLSAVAMTLALLPLYAAAKRLFDERVALLASLLFAIAPLCLTWAQKARPYPLQVLLVACAFWGFVRIYNAPEARQRLIGAGLRSALLHRRIGEAGIDLAWFACGVCGALAMLAQDPAGFFVLGCNVAIAVAIFRDLRGNRILLLNWILAQVLLILIWMSWLPEFLHQIGTHLTAEQIASKHAIFLVTFSQVLGSIRGIFTVAGLYRLAPFFVPVYVALAGVATVSICRHRPLAWPLLAIVVVPICACLAGFFLIHPVVGYVIGTFVWILVPYTILIAYGLLAVRPAALRWAAIGIVLLGNAWGIKNVYQSDTPPLDRVAAVVRTQAQPGDRIVLSEAGSGRWGIAYYLGPPYGGVVSGLDVADWGQDKLIRSAPNTPSRRRIWLVVPDGEVSAVDPGLLHLEMKRAFAQRVGMFQITRFDPCGGSDGACSER